MLKIPISLLRQLLFWLVFFAFSRLIFILFYANLFAIDMVPFKEVITLFGHAFRLDLSSACYILIIPFIVLTTQSMIQPGWLNKVNKIYTAVIILIYSLICNAEIGIYAEWKTKLDYKALYYLKHPKEIADSAQTGQFILLIGVLILQVLLSIYAYNKLFYNNIDKFKRKWIFSVLFFLLVPVLLFLGIRGGLQAIPINQAESYFSKHNIVNHAAVNSGYNLYQSWLENSDYANGNPFNFYPIQEARKTVADLHKVQKDTTFHIFNVPRPNVVLILLESWSGDLIESLGGEPGITPEFHKLEKDGILFTNLYASGNRSEQAMASVFSGFPSLPVTAITHDMGKFLKLPSLNKEMKKAGYQTSYYFGGQLIYGGLRAYIMWNDFDRITEEKDYAPSFPRGKLGVHDQYTFTRQLDELHNEKQPFFSAIFSLSTHSPFDEPMEKVLTWGGNENQYINSAYYTDRCLADYFARARKEAWYENTVFIIVADHSHNSYRNWSANTPQYRKIPLLIYGNALKEEFRGKKISRVSSQTDIAGTLLHQLGLSSQAFTWSRNLFNPYSPEFAYFEINVGCGWVRPDGQLVYQNTTKSYDLMNYKDEVKATREKEAKSYLEVLFQQFIDY